VVILLAGAAAALACGTAPAADFAVERLDLAFADDTRVKIVTKGESVVAVADITFEGSGLLSAIWEIAEPTTSGRASKFRDLSVVNKSLSATKREKLWSPQLPTDVTGTYAIRFRVSRPEPEKTQLLRYFVGQGPTQEALEGKTVVPDSIATRSPDTAVSAETTFSWDPVPGSVGYQVEIYDESGTEKAVVVESGTFGTCLVRHPSELNRPPLVGLMAPGYQTEATLSQLAGSTLTGGNTYLWRVVALGPRGKVLCESPFRRFAFSE
jgi:hypothetical protein